MVTDWLEQVQAIWEGNYKRLDALLAENRVRLAVCAILVKPNMWRLASQITQIASLIRLGFSKSLCSVKDLLRNPANTNIRPS